MKVVPGSSRAQWLQLSSRQGLQSDVHRGNNETVWLLSQLQLTLSVLHSTAVQLYWGTGWSTILLSPVYFVPGTRQLQWHSYWHRCQEWIFHLGVDTPVLVLVWVSSWALGKLHQPLLSNWNVGHLLRAGKEVWPGWQMMAQIAGSKSTIPGSSAHPSSKLVLARRGLFLSFVGR